MRKALTITLISFLILIIAGISILFVMILNGNIRLDSFKFKFGNSYITEIAIDEVYEESFDKVNITTSAGDIKIHESDSDSIKLVIFNKKEKTKVTTDNNILDIDVKSKKCNFFCINPKIAKVELYIPSNYDKDIKITTQYGDINIEKFENATFDIKSNYGDIKIDEINSAKLNLDYGDVKINTINELIAESNYGDIKVNTVNNYLNLSCDYGDIKLDKVNLTKNSTIKADYGDVKINTIQGVYIDSKTSLGDNDVNGSDRTSNMTLTIKVDYGDIEVN